MNNVEIIQNPRVTTIPMYTMQHEQFGIIRSGLVSSYNGKTVKAHKIGSTIRIMSLDNPTYFWESTTLNGGLDVEILNAGSKIVITVPENG